VVWLERKIVWKSKYLIIGMNKNSIFAWASFILFLIGSALILLGVFKYPEYLVELTLAGLGFITIGWAFNALKGRV
tara:strand:- start:417 stop:644 length:228 start_codon:yes stop_codon:yes gene_type:complete